MSPGRSRKKGKEYSEAEVQEAVAMVKSGVSVREAGQATNVPKSTIMDRISGAHGSKRGRPTELTEEEEEYIKEMVLLLGDWGFPFTRLDLRLFVKSYLDKKGMVSRFKNNFPTKRFVDTFVNRHPELRMRNTNPIKRARAAVSREKVMMFYNNYKKCVEDLPPENVFNYDETCMRDDPGSKKCLFRKGTKHCEKVMNTSKSNISVMFCGNAAGHMLPPMVVYKALNMYSGWKKGGEKNFKYSCSASGWFDMYQFELWFEEMMLPLLKKLEGKKLIIGDNVSSHISPRQSLIDIYITIVQ